MKLLNIVLLTLVGLLLLLPNKSHGDTGGDLNLTNKASLSSRSGYNLTLGTESASDEIDFVVAGIREGQVTSAGLTGFTLVDPVISGNLLPAVDNTSDLGSASFSWKNIVLDGDITLGDAGNILTSTGILRVGSTDNGVILRAGGSDRWSIDGSTGALTQNASSGGDIVGNATAFVIRQGTSDAADNKYIDIQGGGGSSSTRGARLIAAGNESALPGQALMLGGAISTGHIIHRLLDASAEIQFQNLSAANLWKITHGGNLTQDGTNGGDIVLSKTAGILRHSTSDAADTSSIQIHGGGSTGGTRGASVYVYGNEASAANGLLDLQTGDVAGAVLRLNALNATGQITLRVASANRWTIDSQGNLSADATGGNNLIMPEDNTTVIQGLAAIPSDISAIISPRLLTFRASAGTSIAHIRGSADSSQPTFDFFKSRATNGSADVIVNASDTTGAVNFWGSDGANFIQAASITSGIDGTPGTNDMPGRLDLRTTADGGTTPSIALTLENDQDALFTQRVTSNRTTDLGWAVVDGTDNTACTSQCTSAAVFGFNLAAGATAPVIVGASDATADICLCAGAS